MRCPSCGFEEDKVVEAIKAGAAGYLLKGAEAEKIVESIKEVKQGGSVIQPSLARSLLRHFRMPEQGKPEPGVLKTEEEAAKERESGAPAPPSGRRALTERELECLQIIAKGLSNNEAARVLGLSKATIRTHLEHIIASHHGLPEHGALKTPMTPEAIAFHFLDNLDAKMAMLEDMERALPADDGSQKGRWTDYKPTLGKRIYFPS